MKDVHYLRRMKFFYCEQLTDSPVFLNKDESYHCYKVMRLRNRAIILVTDGKGNAAEAIILNSHPEKTEIQISKHIKLNSDPYYWLHIAISPLKNPDRLEWFAEKATELGVNEITPLLCSRTEKRSVNTERLRKNVLAAMKQSMRSILPMVHEPTEFNTFLNHLSNEGVKLICTQNADSSIQSILKNQNNITVLIGPEGDFTDDELAISMKSGFRTVNLGTTRLRTETAGLYICAAAKTLLSSP